MEADLAVTFEVDSVRITVDRTLLLESSDVFKAMLESEMLEHNENTIIITDFESDAVLSAVKCMQNPDKVSIELAKYGEALLLFANKYDIRTIQKPAEDYYAANISIENAVKSLQTADQCGLTTLKTASMDFISDNAMPILVQNCLKTELGEDLCNELLRHTQNKPSIIDSELDILESTVVVVSGAGMEQFNGEYRFVGKPSFVDTKDRDMQYGPCFVKENVVFNYEHGLSYGGDLSTEDDSSVGSNERDSDDDDDDEKGEVCTINHETFLTTDHTGKHREEVQCSAYIILEKNLYENRKYGTNEAWWTMKLHCEVDDNVSNIAYRKRADPSMTELFPLPTRLSSDWELIRYDSYSYMVPPVPTVYANRLPNNKISAL